MVLAFQVILGSFASSLLGILLLYSLCLRIRRIKSSNVACKHRCSKSSTAGGVSKPEDVDGTDIIIVGAGVAGAALAYALGKDGRKVHVIERDLTEPEPEREPEPFRVAGEILHAGGYVKLIELGLEDCVSNIDAQRMLGYVIHKDGKSIILPYPLHKFGANVSGISFQNVRFTGRMRAKAATIPNVRLEQGMVTSLIEENGTVKGVQYKTKKGPDRTYAYAPLTVVCDGCFSNLRRSLCTAKVDNPGYMVCLILENCELPSANYSHVILGETAPISFYRISSTKIRAMVDMAKGRLPSNSNMANYLKSVVAPQIPSQLHDAFIAAIEKGHMRMMPNKCMPANPCPTPGVIMIGDALNMRHPGSGGGMTVALSDVVVLRNLLRSVNNLENASILCKYLQSFYVLRKPLAFIVNVSAAALSELYSTPTEISKEILSACFGFVSLDGIFSEVPLAALSDQSLPQLLILVLYAFVFGLYAVGRLLVPIPSPKRLWLASRFLWDGGKILVSSIKADGSIIQMLYSIIGSPSEPPCELVHLLA